jgi:protein ImuA
VWIGMTETFGEAGFPYARGLQSSFGIGPESLLFCEARKLADALWIAEEAARLSTSAAVVLEIRGNPRRLDLTATRRLHARAQQTGRPLFLLRQAALAEPTAAPVRLVVAPAPSGLRETVAGPLTGSIGLPAFAVSISKSAYASNGQFILEWNPDERIFMERGAGERSAGEIRAKDPFAVVSLPRHGADPAAAPGAVVAFKPALGRQARKPAAGDQPPRPQRTAHRGARRAG